LLVVRSTQFAPHWVSPDRHWMTHVPAEHRGAFAGQAWPQAPQSALLEARFWQFPRPRKPPAAHWLNPAEQVHWPSTQVAPTSQATPQAPQFAALVLKSTHAESIPPPGPARGHAVSPPVPQPAAQAPFWQVVPTRHRLPHCPQLASSAWVFVQVVPHCVSPTLH
jgi:hypothetical protein